MPQFKVSGEEGAQALIKGTRWNMHGSETHPQGFISSQSLPFSTQEKKVGFVFPSRNYFCSQIQKAKYRESGFCCFVRPLHQQGLKYHCPLPCFHEASRCKRLTQIAVLQASQRQDEGPVSISLKCQGGEGQCKMWIRLLVCLHLAGVLSRLSTL